MIVDADALEQGGRLLGDICIVGAGAAGISLALQLSGRGLSVLLLEAGSDQPDQATQGLYAGEVADERLHSPPDRYRQRRFGGSTTIWGGRCMPFDPIDFEARDFVPNSGWPIPYEEIARHYPEANRLTETGRCDYDADAVFADPGAQMFGGFRSDRLHTTSLERFSCPTNFGARYGERLRLAPDVTVVQNANCTGIGLDDGGQLVRRLAVRTLRGKAFTVAARMVVLAMGGLEVPRLLMASRDVLPHGIGNRFGTVGRYYMCHIAGNVGTLRVQGPRTLVNHGYLVSPEGIYCRRRLSLAPEEQRRLRVANTVARLHFPRIADPAHGSGVLSGLFLAKNFISYEYGKRLRDGAGQGWTGYARHLANVATSPLETTRFLAHWVQRRSLAERKFPSVVLANRTNLFSLDLHAEQQPRPESRVTLTRALDPLGLPRIRVDWRYHADDIASVRRTLDAFAEEFQRDGRLVLQYDAERLEEDLTRFGAYGGHHIGTARMGTDERTSVVDGNCKVHGVHNLFVASSAVFPTSSQANPTLHLVALSVRLASHLALKLKASPRQPAPELAAVE
ncbi:GMC family oxidoreductase [Pseudorhodoferax sp.]|uniref:GMC family oxidoreductase n=1 Tax=Pseudorhodoferax sp. TaxID=1993553 RepID=UPI002DD699F0|nr:GMC family oxidoreductase [Pseudorhodoferax sp.]